MPRSRTWPSLLPVVALLSALAVVGLVLVLNSNRDPVHPGAGSKATPDHATGSQDNASAAHASGGARLIGDAGAIQPQATSNPDRDPRFPPEFYRSYPPSSRIPLRIPFVNEGIEVTPGQFLPPLNGVKIEDGIPRIQRSRRLPHPGPVVAKVIGPDGQEFWEHEDGSYTSCTYSHIRKPDGSSQQIVATQHGAIPHPGSRGTAK